MGDISEMRGLVVVGTFMAVFIALIFWMPSNLYASSYSPRLNQTSIEGSTFMAWNASHISNITNDVGYANWFDLGGYHFRTKNYYSALCLEGAITVDTHESGWFGISYGYDYFEWYKDGVKVSEINTNGISVDELDYYYNETLEYTIKNSRVTMNVRFDFNATTYATPRLAFEDDALSLIFHSGIDMEASNINAWTLISGILFFNIPTVHPWLNYLISIPIWICIGYLIYIFLLRTIGALFGGGA